MPAPDSLVDGEVTTRERVLELVVEQGPVSAATLAQVLELTPAAVRRHIAHLQDHGQIVVHAPAGPGLRRRGRPARHYVATDAGRAVLRDAYSDLATQALQFLADAAGPDALDAFARARVGELEKRYAALLAGVGPDRSARVRALAEALTADGYAATTRTIGSQGIALQLCQGNCPVQDVAERFPQLCEAETSAFSRLLGVHVQRLATLAGGGHVCTTHVPLAVPAVPTRAAPGAPPGRAAPSTRAAPAAPAAAGPTRPAAAGTGPPGPDRPAPTHRTAPDRTTAPTPGATEGNR
ncbi:HTH domain-containing protein [Georgenia sp. TF02-10]|uniref:helix-turn-helix transcriptional regulator n=1 Tax=Georgenia sp. TF02-10 TaxID=2917725 RepID=UPI001FA7F598|nr:HTH domain-containing protein [Georgenia sp. TF02-10]UNX56044.1 HTH domain-containing protein [Georgenia sp. TF02-10]